MKSKLSPAPKASGARPARAAPVTRVSVTNGDTERSVSVRKIENGYIVRETTYGPKSFKEVERFSAKAPKIDVAAVRTTKGK